MLLEICVFTKLIKVCKPLARLAKLQLAKYQNIVEETSEET